MSYIGVNFLANIGLIFAMLNIWLPDKFDILVLRNMYGIKFGEYFIAINFFFASLIGAFIWLLTSIKRLRIKFRITGFLFLLWFFFSIFLDVILLPRKELTYTLFAYFSFFWSFLLSYILIRNTNTKFFNLLTIFTFFYLGFQTTLFSLFPRITWVTESFRILGFTFFRTITTSGPQTASAYLMVNLYFFLLENIKWKKGTFVTFTFVGYVFTLLSFTRGALLMFFVLTLYSYLHRARKNVYVILFLLLISAVFSSIFVYLYTVRLEQGYNISGDVYRYYVLKYNFNKLKDQNVFYKLLGAGGGQGYSREAYYETKLLKVFPLISPHNAYIVLIFELGILRFCFLLIIVLLYLRKLSSGSKILMIMNLFIPFATEVIYLYYYYNIVLFLVVNALSIRKNDRTLKTGNIQRVSVSMI